MASSACSRRRRHFGCCGCDPGLGNSPKRSCSCLWFMQKVFKGQKKKKRQWFLIAKGYVLCIHLCISKSGSNCPYAHFGGPGALFAFLRLLEPKPLLLRTCLSSDARRFTRLLCSDRTSRGHGLHSAMSSAAIATARPT